MASVYAIAVEAAQKQVDALLNAQERLASAIADCKQRWAKQRSSVVHALIHGGPKPEEQLMFLADEYYLLNDALTKLQAFDLPDAEVALETAKIKEQKTAADSAVAEATAEIDKMRAAISGIEGAKLDITNTPANLKLRDATHDQQLAADHEKRLEERLVNITRAKNGLLASGFMQNPR